MYRLKKTNIVNIFFFISCVLPFIHVFDYLAFDFMGEKAFNINFNNAKCANIDSQWEFIEPCLMWGLAANKYQVNLAVVNMMSLIGSVGALGLVCGSVMSNSKYKRFFLDTSKIKYNDSNTLGLLPFFIWIFVAFMCAYLTAPGGSILSIGYVEMNKSLSNTINFSSLIFVSFILFIFAFCDYIIEKNTQKKIIKGILLLISIFIVVIFLQLIKGDRESITFFVSIVILYFITNNKNRKINFRLFFKSIIIILLILFVSAFIGRFRGGEISNSDNIIVKANETIKYSGQGDSFYDFFISNISSGTWSGSLLSLISVAGDSINGQTKKYIWTSYGSTFQEKPFEFYFGKTYLDYLLSLPPGFVADWVGYQRPIDGYSGPAWEMRYGLGGVHGFVVPFINFSLYGVFIFSFLMSYFVNRTYDTAYNIPNVKNLAFIGVIICIAPHWMWYGDKYAINAIIISYISLWLYRLVLKIRL